MYGTDNHICHRILHFTARLTIFAETSSVTTMVSRISALLLSLLLTTADLHSDDISGSWHGTLQVTPQVSLKIGLNIVTSGEGNTTVTLDSPDQGAYGIAGEVKHLSQDSIEVAIPGINASFAGRKTGEGIRGKFSQGFMARNLLLSPGTWELNRPQTPKPPFPYSTEDVRFKSDNDSIILAGTLTLPPGANTNTPIAVMVTGSGLQNRDEELFGHKPFAVIADYLARNGIGTLRYDDRGFGESTGDASDATMADFAADAKAAVAFLRDMSFNHIGIIGHSEGAQVAFMLAGKRLPAPKRDEVIVYPGRPDFIVALGAPSVQGDSILADQSAVQLRQGGIPESIIADYSEALIKIYGQFGKMDKENLKASVDTICSRWPNNPIYASLKANMKHIVDLSNPYLVYLVGYSPAQSIADTKCPALVMYGERDTQVSPALNMDRMKQLAPTADIRLYPELNHLFQHSATGSVQEYSTIEETISPEVLADIATFINSLKL